MVYIQLTIYLQLSKAEVLRFTHQKRTTKVIKPKQTNAEPEICWVKI